jgi:hypothetical protein
MSVFSNKTYNVPSLQNIHNKEYLLWLEKMYENCIENCSEDETVKIQTFLEIRDAILLKIASLDREERIVSALSTIK